MQVSLCRDVCWAPDQAASDEAVVNRNDEQRDDVEDEEGGSGVDLRMQFSGVRIGGARHKRHVGVAGGEGVQVGEDGLGNGQGDREHPDGPNAQADA